MRTSARRQFWWFSVTGTALASVVIVGCSWWATGGSAADFTVDVGQAPRTVDEYLANPSSTATETQIAGRRVVDFRSSADQPDCDDAIAAPTGSVVIAVTQFLHDEACAAATRVLTPLAPVLP